MIEPIEERILKPFGPEDIHTARIWVRVTDLSDIVQTVKSYRTQLETLSLDYQLLTQELKLRKL
jgi:hypothetical protein